MNADARARAGRWAALLAVVLAIYLPDVGHGFIQDDFAWIAHARSDGVLGALNRAFTTSLGFFRPIVTLSFGVNEWMFGLQPFGYGITNLLLAIACMLGVERLGRRVGLGQGYAMLAAAVWVLNVHGINMSVLWISARTSLLATLFGLLAANAFESRRRMLAGVWIMLALLSKEEAVLLPFVLATWRLVDGSSGGSISSGGSKDPPLLVQRSGSTRGPASGRGGSLDPPGAAPDLAGTLRGSWPLFGALAVYAVLRTQSGAFTPMTAPDFYRFTADPAHLARNVIEYLMRSAATGGIVLAALIAVARTIPRLDRIQRSIVSKGIVWWIGGFAVTLWLPVRSSLYAVLPSVGVALIVAACAASLESTLPVARRRALVIVGLLLPFLLLPIYRARNVRWVSMADVSAATLAHAHARLPELPDRAVIALVDESDVRANFTNTFGGLTSEASRLFLTRGIELAIDPLPDASRPRYTLRLSELNRR